MWYMHLRTQTKEHYAQIIETTRLRVLDRAEADGVAPSENLLIVPAVATTPATPALVATTPQREAATSSPAPRGRAANRRRQRRARSSSSGTPTPIPRPAGGKRAWDPTPEPLQVPFPEPPPRSRPSEYLRRRCPACFGNLKHDPATLADVNVCADTCFTQKKKKSPRDPPRTHPKTHFVPEEQAAETEAYANAVRGTEGQPKQSKRHKAMLDALEDEDDYDHPDLLLPPSVLDSCEASFKAADDVAVASSRLVDRMLGRSAGIWGPREE
ncbi:hypothetical protein C8R44DRAFT_894459 [Mycena epipterygia]|nr:hypothetical protein C8R44DRAFT_894459 [Mycena epipterygia]